MISEVYSIVNQLHCSGPKAKQNIMVEGSQWKEASPLIANKEVVGEGLLREDAPFQGLT